MHRILKFSDANVWQVWYVYIMLVNDNVLWCVEILYSRK
jgi:hypothetical protein